MTLSAKDDASKKIERVRVGVGQLAFSVGKANQVLGAVAIGGLAYFGAQIAEVTVQLQKLDAQQDRAEVAFEELARQAGSTGEGIFQAISRATDGTVSNIDIMLAANKSLLLGIRATDDEWEKLAATARFRARAMGLSTTQAIIDLTTAIGRESRIIADNLGIVWDMDQILSDYAGTINKTKDELTAMERKQALFQDTIRQGTAMLQEAGGNIRDQADAWETLDATLTNLKAAFGDLLGPIMLKAAELVAEGMEKVKEGLDEASDLREAKGAWKVAEDQIIALAEAAQYLGISVRGMQAADFIARTDLSDAKELADAYYALKEALASYGITTERASMAFEDMSSSFSLALPPVREAIEFISQADFDPDAMDPTAIKVNMAEVESELSRLRTLLPYVDDELQRVSMSRMIEQLQQVRDAARDAGALTGDYVAVIRMEAPAIGDVNRALEEQLALRRGSLEAEREAAAIDRLRQAAELDALAGAYRRMADVAADFGDTDKAEVFTQQAEELQKRIDELVPGIESMSYTLEALTDEGLRAAAEGMYSFDASMIATGGSLSRLQIILKHTIPLFQQLHALRLEELGKDMEKGLGAMDSSLLSLVGDVPRDRIEEIRSDFQSEIDEMYAGFAESINSGTAVSAWEIDYQTKVITEKYENMVDGIKDALDFDPVAEALKGGLNQLDSALLGIVDLVPRARLDQMRTAYRLELQAYYYMVAEQIRAGTYVSSWEIDYQTRIITKKYEDQIAAIENALDREEGAYKSGLEAINDLRSLVASALQPTDVTALDMAQTALGTYADKWDEDARRLDAIAERGFAELEAHPDWAAALNIPPEILAGPEEQLMGWARMMAPRVRNLFEPGLLADNVDEMADAVEQYVRDQEAREVTLDMVVGELQARGFSREKAEQEVRDLYGVPELNIATTLTLTDDSYTLLPLEVDKALALDQPRPVSLEVAPPEGGGGIDIPFTVSDDTLEDLSITGEGAGALFIEGFNSSLGAVSPAKAFLDRYSDDLKNNEDDLVEAGGATWSIIWKAIADAIYASPFVKTIAAAVSPYVVRELREQGYL